MVSMAPWFCGAMGPKRVASRTPLHGCTGCGGRKRRSPTGGAAYGMPRKSRIPTWTHPVTAPVVVSTVVIALSWSLLRGDGDLGLSLGVDKGGPVHVDRD